VRVRNIQQKHYYGGSPVFTKESSNRAVVDFKIAFNEAIAFAGEKQETLAHRIGVTQGQINNWCNPHSDRNFPMALFHLLPIKMQTALMEYLNARCDGGTKFGEVVESMEEKIIELVTLEGDLVRQYAANPVNAHKTISKMRETLDRAEKEVNQLSTIRA
jgi:hypothetical protein